MSEPNQFRQYQIVQDAEGNNVELVRSAEQVAVLAFDTMRLDFVHCHVLLKPLASKAAFDEACGRLRKNGHPLIARMVEFGEDEGNAFYITGNVDGETLRAWLSRQQEIPTWLAVMIACRSLEAALAVCERGDLLCDQPAECLRVVQTGPQSAQVIASDFRVIEVAGGKGAKQRVLKANFDRQGKFLKSFLQEQSGGGPTGPDTMLPAADFGELLGGCLTAMGPNIIAPVRELRNALLKFAPEHITGEIPAAQKPRALVAPLLASYQEVARGVVNLVRIQSQRLDMTNPYAMRGTLTRAGRSVWVEQVPPVRIGGQRVEEADRQLLKLSKKRELPGLVGVVLVNESEGITCVAEEAAEGVSLAELLRERRSLDAQETYLVLAGLDAAISQIEQAALSCRKLRLEDVFLLTGFAREDSRTAKLLVSKLNEWPAFSVIVRAHPTLASMSGRGTDPGALLPSTLDAAGRGAWTAGWMAATGRFLLGLESLGGRGDADAVSRDREAMARLLDDELTKARDGIVSSRADFLARYARVVQHYDLVKPIGAAAESEQTPAAARGARPAPAAGKSVRRRADPVPQEQPVLAGALTAGIEPSADKPHIGFAEILFQSGGQNAEASAEADWSEASGSGSWTPDGSPVPLWLRAAVFIGGSMLLGGLLAHLTGDAFWQKNIPAAAPIAPVEGAAQPGSVPKAVPVPDDLLDLKPPPEKPSAISSGGVSLKPPTSTGGSLRDLLTTPSTAPAGNSSR